ncbi:uncharacterized protein [Triticum aestivum]|uniref:uncharacterized protein n=1 Tax=Triticum aestivum TaxID=4565 RepID=UPI001D02B855|nr:uncharacterized protein LOC123055913 [Triticum aestivum]
MAPRRRSPSPFARVEALRRPPSLRLLLISASPAGSAAQPPLPPPPLSRQHGPRLPDLKQPHRAAAAHSNRSRLARHQRHRSPAAAYITARVNGRSEDDEPNGPPPDYAPEWWDDMRDSDDETLRLTNDPNDEDYDF